MNKKLCSARARKGIHYEQRLETEEADANSLHIIYEEDQSVDHPDVSGTTTFSGGQAVSVVTL